MGIVSRADAIMFLIPQGTICLESALAFHGLCTFSNDYLILLNNSNFTINNNQFIRFYPNLLEEEGVVPFNDKLSITTPERTICEMIVNDRRDDFIYESLECYLYDNNPRFDINNLYSCAKKYNVLSKLMYYVNEKEEEEGF